MLVVTGGQAYIQKVPGLIPTATTNIEIKRK
jgi:hypothetical protein